MIPIITVVIIKVITTCTNNDNNENKNNNNSNDNNYVTAFIMIHQYTHEFGRYNVIFNTTTNC